MRIARLLFASALLAATAHAQGASSVKNTQLDFAVPDSPAFSVLGLSPDTVTRPTTPRALAAALLNGVDQNGDFQTGVALDTAPYMLWYGDKVGIGAYQKSRVLRFVSRSQLSVGTTKGASSEDKSAKVALGFHFTFMDYGDPRMDKQFLSDLNQAIMAAEEATREQRVKQGKPEVPFESDTQDQEDFLALKNAELAKRIPPLIEAQKKQRWNRTAWIAAFAPSWATPDGSLGNMAWNGAGAWTSLSYGFEQVPGLRDNSQIILHLRYRNHELVPELVNNATVFQNSIAGGARWVIGKNDAHGSFETVYFRTRPNLGPRERFLRMTVGAEKKIAENLWLHLGIGGESGRKNGQDKLFILGAFRWGTSKEASIVTGNK